MVNLKTRNNKDRDLFNKKIQIQVEDDNNKARNDKIGMLQRFNLNLKEMKARQEREAGSFKGEFRTKGGSFSEKFGEKEDQ